jgi:hypothetical protein
MNPEPQQSEKRPVIKTLLTLAATYLATLAIIAYPLGFLTLWIQIWREYTHDAATAIYAVSLIPVAVVVVKAFAALGTALFFVMGVSASASQFIAFYGAVDLEGEETRTRLSGRRFRRFWEFFLFDKKWRAAQLLNGFLVGALLPWAFELVSIDSGTDAFFYTCSVLIAGGGVVIGNSMLFKHLNEQHDLRAIYAKALPIMISSVVVAAFLLIPLQPPEFPVVRFSEGTVEEARLISHSEGYWYVIAEGKRAVMALPDNTVGTATVSEEPAPR